jgi:hypothetical protein
MLSLNISANTTSRRDQAIIDDLLFFEAWKNGLVPWSITANVVLRIRQIRRANPALSDNYHA